VIVIVNVVVIVIDLVIVLGSAEAANT